MRDAGIIWGVGFETNREDIVGVVSVKMKMFCSGMIVSQFDSSEAELRNFRDTLNMEATVLIAESVGYASLTDSSSERAGVLVQQEQVCWKLWKTYLL